MRKIIISETQLLSLQINIKEDISDPSVGLISPLPFSSGLGKPANGFRTSQRPNHDGVDLIAGSGSAVIAIADGTVSNDTGYNTQRKTCGGLIRIFHPTKKDDEYESAYCHIQKIFVSPGQMVKQGQLLGLSGGGSKDPNKGNADGAHLHFQLKKRKKIIDPMNIINFSTEFVGPEEIIKSDEIEITPLPDITQQTLFDKEMGGKLIKRYGGNSKKNVEKIQTMLSILEYDLGTYGPNKDGIDSKFGPQTEAAVKKFQEDVFKDSKEWDGVVGPKTYDKLIEKIKEVSDKTEDIPTNPEKDIKTKKNEYPTLSLFYEIVHRNLKEAYQRKTLL
jgi:hypothetical protein